MLAELRRIYSGEDWHWSLLTLSVRRVSPTAGFHSGPPGRRFARDSSGSVLDNILPRAVSRVRRSLSSTRKRGFSC